MLLGNFRQNNAKSFHDETWKSIKGQSKVYEQKTKLQFHGQLTDSMEVIYERGKNFICSLETENKTFSSLFSQNKTNAYSSTKSVSENNKAEHWVSGNEKELLLTHVQLSSTCLEFNSNFSHKRDPSWKVVFSFPFPILNVFL